MVKVKEQIWWCSKLCSGVRSGYVYPGGGSRIYVCPNQWQQGLLFEETIRDDWAEFIAHEMAHELPGGTVTHSIVDGKQVNSLGACEDLADSWRWYESRINAGSFSQTFVILGCKSEDE